MTDESGTVPIASGAQIAPRVRIVDGEEGRERAKPSLPTPGPSEDGYKRREEYTIEDAIRAIDYSGSGSGPPERKRRTSASDEEGEGEWSRWPTNVVQIFGGTGTLLSIKYGKKIAEAGWGLKALRWGGRLCKGLSFFGAALAGYDLYCDWQDYANMDAEHRSEGQSISNFKKERREKLFSFGANALCTAIGLGVGIALCFTGVGTIGVVGALATVCAGGGFGNLAGNVAKSLISGVGTLGKIFFGRKTKEDKGQSSIEAPATRTVAALPLPAFSVVG